MKRREFMIGAVAATGLAAVSTGCTQSSNQSPSNQSLNSEDKRSRIALMMFGLNSIVKNNKPPSPERTIDIWDIGELCADRYGIHNVELQSMYFPSTEMSWLRDFKARLAETKTRVVQINIEFGAGLQLTENTQPSNRLQMIDLHRVWFDKVAFLECPRVLINQGRPTQENKELAISNLKELAALAKAKNIIVSSENRGGGGRRPVGQGRAGGPGAPGERGGQPPQAPPPAAPPQSDVDVQPSYILLTEILRSGGGYTCVDFQNFPNQDEQQAGIRGMLPYTSGLLHAGMRYDLHEALAITRELGYNGIYSIKAGGGAETNPLDTTQEVLDVLLAEI